ncbi:MAG TPA: type II toxin-antitoxin system HicA family toxin [Candidatus Rifleibacterium sp.]|nr:type II toxin-antitoxin system HicA family toxin [Candidatus Rifleibacterium sp.]HPT46777.1 type II toxin-antitoxin system HicA family toxin [Candidatus Rifleibacterium sp.]
MINKPLQGHTGKRLLKIDNTTYKLYIYNMTGKQVVKIMQQHGVKLDRISGSHHVMVKEGSRSVPVPVPVHGSADLGAWAIKILKEAGIKV